LQMINETDEISRTKAKVSDFVDHLPIYKLA
jgi:hypothetical protein